MNKFITEQWNVIFFLKTVARHPANVLKHVKILSNASKLFILLLKCLIELYSTSQYVELATMLQLSKPRVGNFLCNGQLVCQIGIIVQFLLPAYI